MNLFFWWMNISLASSYVFPPPSSSNPSYPTTTEDISTAHLISPITSRSSGNDERFSSPSSASDSASSAQGKDFLRHFERILYKTRVMDRLENTNISMYDKIHHVVLPMIYYRLTPQITAGGLLEE